MTVPTGTPATRWPTRLAERESWECGDPLGAQGAEVATRAYSDWLKRIEVCGTLTAPKPIRRKIGRSLLALVGGVVMILGFAAYLYGISQ